MLDASTLFQAHPDPMWIFDPETRRLRAVNDAALQTYGHKADGHSALCLLGPCPEAEAQRLTEFLRQRGSSLGDLGLWRLLRHDGVAVHAAISAQHAEYEGKSVILVSARDTSALLRIAARTVQLGAWRLALADGLIVWTEQAAAIHEAPVPECPSVEDWIACFAPDHQPIVRAALRDCAQDGKSFDLISKFVTAKGNTRWVRSTGEAERDAQGRIIAINGALQDSTELVQVRKRAEDSEQLLELAGWAVRLGGWRVSLVDQQVSWTDGVAAIHELPPGTMPTFDGGINYFAPEEQAAARQVFEACAREGIPFDNVRDVITAKGNRVKVRSMGVPVRDDNGAIIAVQGAMQDISELEAARRKADELSTRLAATLENIGDAFFMLDRAWRFTYLNSHAEILMERRRETLIGRKIFEEFPEAAGSAFAEQYIRAFESGQTVRFEQPYPPLNKTFHVNAHPTPEGLAVYFSDITQERQRDEQLRLLDAAVGRINDVVIITEAGKTEADDDSTIVYVNDAFERLTGYTRAEVIGQTPRIMQGPETQRSELDRIARALAARMPVRAELINYTKAGHAYWLEIDITPIANADGVFTHFVAIQRDVTARRNAEEAVRISETRFRLIARSTGNAVWEWDIAGSRKWWSEGMEQIFGHQPHPEGAPLSVWRLNIHPDDAHRVDEAMDRLLSGQTDTIHERYRFRRGDGSWATVEDRAFAIHDDTGRTIRVLGSISDVSERLHLEDRLRQSQKLEAVGQLTGGVAHDFNNLLTVIIGNTEFLQEELSDDHPLRKFADMSAIAADRAAELTTRLLAFSRKQALRPQVIDVNAVVIGVEDMLRRTLGEDIDIRMIRADGLCRTEADLGQLEAALLNLAINSRDAMPDGGALTIETANVVLDEAYVAGEPDLTPGEYVVIAVSDTGYGIARDKIAHVFEPFFTTKPVGKGTGLGLSMVYGFVKQTGGHITIYSEPDEGTTVRLYFPAIARAPLPSDPEGEGRRLLRGTETVLVVEDDALIQQQLTAQLEGLGYTVVTASAGLPALAILRERSDIDLLFTDVVLPGGMNGRQIADAALVIRPDLKVIYTSGYSDNAIIHHGRLDDGVALLGKPYRRSALALMLRKILDA